MQMNDSAVSGAKMQQQKEVHNRERGKRYVLALGANVTLPMCGIMASSAAKRVSQKPERVGPTLATER